uniref:DH domain-containing protein n=1 Tax=Percolomonas cosmopolitus TaxID=63605 RepID=A0A7S1PJ40_9EUKA|eukprot:CAMPEP_0117450396 /NCGR_PEP_ID=MMETSP0759-20121206/8446_1 /TAXON_ID=63605 /ORGANISM="Percolomonas cosmopolitus, Strain WS" /LENGTH=1333 /DNA_ID=CAMNT_0005242915 /DNA_START=89 /DNA_END=4090 /DNA_ORIENTATION=+
MTRFYSPSHQSSSKHTKPNKTSTNHHSSTGGNPPKVPPLPLSTFTATGNSSSPRTSTPPTSSRRNSARNSTSVVPTSLFHSATILLQQGRPVQALETLEKHLEQNEHLPRQAAGGDQQKHPLIPTLSLIALIHKKLNNTSQAIQYYLKASELGDEAAMCHLGVLMMETHSEQDVAAGGHEEAAVKESGQEVIMRMEQHEVKDADPLQSPSTEGNVEPPDQESAQPTEHSPVDTSTQQDITTDPSQLPKLTPNQVRALNLLKKSASLSHPQAHYHLFMFQPQHALTDKERTEYLKKGADLGERKCADLWESLQEDIASDSNATSPRTNHTASREQYHLHLGRSYRNSPARERVEMSRTSPRKHTVSISPRCAHLSSTTPLPPHILSRSSDSLHSASTKPDIIQQITSEKIKAVHSLRLQLQYEKQSKQQCMKRLEEHYLGELNDLRKKLDAKTSHMQQREELWTRETQQLRRKVGDICAELENYDQVREENAQLSTENHKLRQQALTFQHDMQKGQSQHELRTQLSQNALVKTQTENELLRGRLQTLEQTLSESQRELSAMRAKLAQTQRDISVKTEECTQLNEMNQQLTRQLEKSTEQHKSEYESMSAENLMLRKRFQEKVQHLTLQNEHLHTENMEHSQSHVKSNVENLLKHLVDIKMQQEQQFGALKSRMEIFEKHHREGENASGDTSPIDDATKDRLVESRLQKLQERLESELEKRLQKENENAHLQHQLTVLKHQVSQQEQSTVENSMAQRTQKLVQTLVDPLLKSMQTFSMRIDEHERQQSEKQHELVQCVMSALSESRNNTDSLDGGQQRGSLPLELSHQWRQEIQQVLSEVLQSTLGTRNAAYGGVFMNASGSAEPLDNITLDKTSSLAPQDLFPLEKPGNGERIISPILPEVGNNRCSSGDIETRRALVEQQAVDSSQKSRPINEIHPNLSHVEERSSIPSQSPRSSSVHSPQQAIIHEKVSPALALTLSELKNTNQVYLFNLQRLTQLYVCPLGGESVAESTLSLLPHNVWRTLFGLFDSLQLCTLEVAQELDIHLKDERTPGDGEKSPLYSNTNVHRAVGCLHDVIHTTFQTLHVQYANKYGTIRTILREQRQNNAQFEEFIRQVESNNQHHSIFRLEDFIFLPIRQVNKYEALLRRLLRNTEQHSLVHAKLSLDYNLMRSITQSINRAIASANHDDLVTLNSELQVTDLVKPGRRFIRSFHVWMSEGIKGGQQREGNAYIFNDCIICVPQCGISSDAYGAKSYYEIPLDCRGPESENDVERVVSESECFLLLHWNRKFAQAFSYNYSLALECEDEFEVEDNYRVIIEQREGGAKQFLLGGDK